MSWLSRWYNQPESGTVIVATVGAVDLASDTLEVSIPGVLTSSLETRMLEAVIDDGRSSELSTLGLEVTR
ncbi:MAG: hypothetical protein HC933_09715 [Pleurocapsa sp. SU_196_0]|nr:hypothetical protein [Pleurocapsa sp. SU_196_0]